MAYKAVQALLVSSILLLSPRGARAAELRRYVVTLQGQRVGEATLSVRGTPGRGLVYTHHSRLTTTRGGHSSVRILHEEVRVRDGILLSSWAVRIAGGERQAVSAYWDPKAAAMVVRRGEHVDRVPVGSPAGVETLFEAPRRLIENGSVGARRRVFDLPDAKLGWVVLQGAKDARGWAETEELGVRVRSRWTPGALLPDVLDLVDIGLRYTTEGIEAGGDAGHMADLTGGSVPVEGTLVPGVRLRLTPREAWPGVACAGREVILPAQGPLCRAGEEQPHAQGMPPIVGPHVEALVAQVHGKNALARARSLARTIDAHLEASVDGAGLWEASPEVALARGQGDCNEAVAVFLAAARLLRLEARRRVGLYLDPGAADRLWPHTWVEVRTRKGWVRVDPARGEAPARGVYLDLGDGETLAGRLRAVAPALRGARVKVVGAPPPGMHPAASPGNESHAGR